MDENEEIDEHKEKAGDSPLRDLNHSFKRSMSIEGSPLIFASKKIDLSRTPGTSFNRKMSFELAECAGLTTIRERTQSIQEGKVLVIMPTESDVHMTGDYHQENALRTTLLTGVDGALRRNELNKHITWISPDLVKAAPLADLLRVHEYSYIKHLENKCAGIQRSLRKTPSTTNIVSASPSPIQSSPFVPYNKPSETGKAYPPFYAPEGLLDPDSPLSPHSFDAAKKYCGAAMLAVDLLLKDESNLHRAAFVVGRPPGHHAGPNGCVPSEFFWKIPQMASSGFCLLNTVGVAAGYARYKYTTKTGNTPRIAIVDFDVHHGNGTEEIVKNLRPHTIYMPLPSSWAPVAQLSYKPWLNEMDKDEVMFASINLFSQEQFYPCSGDGSDDTLSPLVINIPLTPVKPVIWDPRVRSKLTAGQRIEFNAIASKEFREKISGDLIPYIRQFQPDLLLISAGFDAHQDDMYHFLDEEDYYWVTKELCSIVYETGGKVISVLEGGYSLAPPVAQHAPFKAAHKPHATRNKRASSNDDEDEKLRVVEKFTQQPSDGGLVKGVLAHVAALSHVDNWMEL